MTDLESYIRAHAQELDALEAPEGHEARFLARLEEAGTAPAADGPAPRESRAPLQSFLQSFRAKRRNLRPVPRILAPALALTVLAALLVLRPGTPHDFRFVANDPQAVYLAYMDRVARLYRAFPAADGVERDAALQALTEEDIPLFEQLPGELGPREQARILKHYYGELLAGARKITQER